MEETDPPTIRQLAYFADRPPRNTVWRLLRAVLGLVLLIGMLYVLCEVVLYVWDHQRRDRMEREDVECFSRMRMIAEATRRFMADRGGSIPESLDLLVREGYLPDEHALVCPSDGRRYGYRVSGTHSNRAVVWELESPHFTGGGMVRIVSLDGTHGDLAKSDAALLLPNGDSTCVEQGRK